MRRFQWKTGGTFVSQLVPSSSNAAVTSEKLTLVEFFGWERLRDAKETVVKHSEVEVSCRRSILWDFRSAGTTHSFSSFAGLWSRCRAPAERSWQKSTVVASSARRLRQAAVFAYGEGYRYLHILVMIWPRICLKLHGLFYWKLVGLYIQVRYLFYWFRPVPNFSDTRHITSGW